MHSRIQRRNRRLWLLWCCTAVRDSSGEVLTLRGGLSALLSSPTRSKTAVCSRVVGHLRGGGIVANSVIEVNPNYIPPPHLVQSRHHLSSTSSPFFAPTALSSSPLTPLHTTAQQEGGSNHREHNQSLQVQTSEGVIEAESYSFDFWQPNIPRPTQSAWNQATTFLYQLRLANGATAFNTGVSCLAVFVLWQIPACHNVLRRWFVLHPSNASLTTMLLSSVSHSNLSHLVLNLAALFRFTPTVRNILSRSTGPKSWPLWPLFLGSSMVGSLFHLAWGGESGCMGLSDVTLALLAVYAKTCPEQSMGLWLAGIVPLRLPALQLLHLILAWSCGGTLRSALRLGSTSSSRQVAHAAHLGGLVFGLVYYELWNQRRTWQSWLMPNPHQRGPWMI